MAGAWIRVRPGAYIDAASADTPHDAARRVALARLVALRRQLTAGYVLSHGSAALLWGLPLLRTPSGADVIGATHPTGRSRDVRRHVMTLSDSDVVMRHGHPVTSLERTVVDCAATLGPRAGLVVADAALHLGASRERCQEILDAMPGHRGVATARAVIEFADDGAESPGESVTRFILLRAGFPPPETQVRVATHLGPFWSDLGWADWGLLAEYDGRAKYQAKGSATAAVIDEKRRQDAIEEAGYRVIRVVAEDVRGPKRLVGRVLRLAPPGTADRLQPRRALGSCAASTAF